MSLGSRSATRRTSAIFRTWVNVTILDDAEEVIVSVQPPRVEVEEELGRSAAEPEVIGEKAEEE
jgi:hypothetical protein